MSLGNTLENAFALLYFNAVAIANLADNAAASPLTNLFVSLHSAWPGEAGAQNTSEVAYTGYGRAQVARTSGGWTVTANSVSPTANIDFAQASAGSDTARFFGVGRASSGAGVLDWMGVIGGPPRVFTAAVSDVITSYAHGLAVNDRVAFFPAYANSLPTGITEGTEYFVITTPDANTFTISTTQGGGTLDITAVGMGFFQRIQPINITTGVIPRLTTSSAILLD